VKPIEKSFLMEIAAKTPLLVTVEENTFIGGTAGAVREVLEGENVQVRTIALPDAFVEHGTQAKLREKVGLSAEKIASRILDIHKQWTAQKTGFHKD
jgi:1-deoxy-D-xylulose-5-phosphate synthase